ncbi:MAG: mechanosensitive ion channel [Myxococcales bacterium]|nr:mechanosensitive ion channel [Myxococcales bacterium]
MDVTTTAAHVFATLFASLLLVVGAAGAQEPGAPELPAVEVDAEDAPRPRPRPRPRRPEPEPAAEPPAEATQPVDEHAVEAHEPVEPDAVGPTEDVEDEPAANATPTEPTPTESPPTESPPTESPPTESTPTAVEPARPAPLEAVTDRSSEPDAPPAERAPAPAVTSAPSFPSVIIQSPGAESPLLGEELHELIDALGGGSSSLGMLGLLLIFGVAITLAIGLRRVRDGFPEHGVIPALLAFLHLALRLTVVALAAAFVLRLVPARLALAALLVLGASAVAIGWSARDVLPDLLAGFVLVFERRVRPGTWVTAASFAGQVHRLGFRVTRLRDAQGRQVDVPNRHLLTAPVTTGGTHEREHEVELHLETSLSASAVRGALRDAVLASPWVFPGAEPIVLRDPDVPERWRVRGRLLEARYGARFEGELLERAEALLAHPDASGERSLFDGLRPSQLPPPPE